MPGMMPDEEEQTATPKVGVETPSDISDPDVEEGTVANVEGEAATPEEQAAYDEFVKEGLRLLYEGGEVRPSVLKLLDDDPSDLMAVLENAEELQQFSPVVALAAAAALITLQVAKETGQTEGVILLHGGQALLEELAELAQQAGIYDYSEDEMGMAMRMAADLFREAAADEGIINLDEAKEEWGEIVQADQEGRLGDVLPQLANAEVAQPPQQEVPDGQS